VQASDLLGTPVAALNLATGIAGEQLRTPYGQARFSASASTGGGMRTPACGMADHRHIGSGILSP
jgi:hypothetical protein